MRGVFSVEPNLPDERRRYLVSPKAVQSGLTSSSIPKTARTWDRARLQTVPAIPIARIRWILFVTEMIDVRSTRGSFLPPCENGRRLHLICDRNLTWDSFEVHYTTADFGLCVIDYVAIRVAGSYNPQ